jgi:hypothetical protein
MNMENGVYWSVLYVVDRGYELHVLYILLTTIRLMSGGSVYKDHTFNKETAQYIAQIFTVQYKYMNVYSTVHIQ